MRGPSPRRSGYGRAGGPRPRMTLELVAGPLRCFIRTHCRHHPIHHQPSSPRMRGPSIQKRSQQSTASPQALWNTGRPIKSGDDAVSEAGAPHLHILRSTFQTATANRSRGSMSPSCAPVAIAARGWGAPCGAKGGSCREGLRSLAQRLTARPPRRSLGRRTVLPGHSELAGFPRPPLYPSSL